MIYDYYGFLSDFKLSDMTTLGVKLLHENARLPERKTLGAAGLDLFLPKKVTIDPGELVKIPLGISVAIPEGYVGRIHGRSSLEAKGLHCLAGVIDSDYRGELIVVIQNLNPSDGSNYPFVFDAHDRICQLLIVPVLKPIPIQVENLPSSQRDQGGFGSTGH